MTGKVYNNKKKKRDFSSIFIVLGFLLLILAIFLVAKNQYSIPITAELSPTPNERKTLSPSVTPLNTPAQSDTPAQGDTDSIDEIRNTFLDSTSADYSFLDGISTSYFEDADQESGAWFPGKIERNLDTGDVEYVWDRYSSTLDLIAKYSAIYRKNTDSSVCYLTFDVGYDNGNINKILDTLAEKNVKAIFFVTGQVTDSNPDLIKRIHDEGHLIGNHTNTHINMAKASNSEFVSQLLNTEKKLKAILGEDFKTVYYRPPEGACSERDLCLAKRLGYQTVFWSFAYYDYNDSDQPESEAALLLTKQKLHNGCVYLLHSTSATNANILSDLIDFITTEGYQIHRLDS